MWQRSCHIATDYGETAAKMQSGLWWTHQHFDGNPEPLFMRKRTASIGKVSGCDWRCKLGRGSHHSLTEGLFSAMFTLFAPC